jgi:alpha-L-fucosidase 2
VKGALSSREGDSIPSFKTLLKSHQKWWRAWWGKSALSLPDDLIQTHWERERYKYGACTGRGLVPISLQSVWTADNGRLPPWSGDFHHDLNTQLSYWPAYAANHMDAGRCFTDWLWKVKPEAVLYTRRFFQREGLSFPGVTDIKGRLMGGWWQYSHNPTVAAWLGQHFYWQWRFSMDREFLEKRAYPWIAEAAKFFLDFSRIDKGGLRTLPLSSSPEINDDREDAWFPKTTNFDLAFIRWTFDKAAELAMELGLEEEARRWRECLSQWPPLALSEDQRLLVAPAYPLPYSHRHFSHLVAIHPLGLYDRDKTGDRAVIEASLAELDRMGTDLWVGYSFSWLANLKARAEDGQGAAEALRIFARVFCSPNTFHLNGDQSGSGYSRFTYRPFTLEGNFAWMSGLLEMLLQSHNDLIRIFPAVPAAWADISFRDLRAQGAFLISAERRDGRTVSVRCLSEKGGRLRLRNPFAEGPFKSRGIARSRIREEGDVLCADLRPGEVLILSRIR